MFEVTTELLNEFRKKRASLKLTNTDAAKILGISRQQLSKIDNGHVKFIYVKTHDAFISFINGGN